MKKVILLLLSLSLFIPGYSQPSIKKIDSIVKSIESQKTLKLNTVCDTFPVAYSELTNIECVRFYSVKGKLVKAIYSLEYHNKDGTNYFIEFGYNFLEEFKQLTSKK